MLAFRFTLQEVHSQPISRLCSKSARIHNNTSEIPMNSKAEWHQPVATRYLEELQVQGAGGGARSRRRGK